jgi:hypothetical protein
MGESAELWASLHDSCECGHDRVVRVANFFFLC